MEHLDTKPIGVTLRIIHPQTEYLLQTPQLIVIKNSKSHNWVFFSCKYFYAVLFIAINNNSNDDNNNKNHCVIKVQISN